MQVIEIRQALRFFFFGEQGRFDRAIDLLSSHFGFFQADIIRLALSLYGVVIVCADGNCRIRVFGADRFSYRQQIAGVKSDSHGFSRGHMQGCPRGIPFAQEDFSLG